jgi:hypothetical protein
MPSDNDSQDLPPPPRRGWYLADLGATDASWNLARTETKKVFQGVMVVVGRRCRHTWLIHFLIVDQRKMMIFMLR